jgi:hypothetical protein
MSLVSVLAQAAQPVECTNCDGESPVGALLAAVAVVISYASLHITSLRRPRIDVALVPHGRELHFQSWTGPKPRKANVYLELEVANTGASGTVVSAFRVAHAFQYHGAGGSPWNEVQHRSIRGTVDSTIAPPLVFERGDARVYRVDAELLWKPEIDSPIGREVAPDELAFKGAQLIAERLRQIEAVTVGIEWVYHRRTLIRRKRQTVYQRAPIRLKADFPARGRCCLLAGQRGLCVAGPDYP